MLFRNCILGVSFYVILLQFISEQTLAKRASSFCDGLEPFKYDENWLVQNVSQKGWYLQYSHPTVRQHLGSLLKGRELGENESEYSGLCARTTYVVTEKYLGGVYTGFKTELARKNCTFRDMKPLDCTNYNVRIPRKVLVTEQVPIYFDQREIHNYKLIVYCFENGDNGWLSISKKKALTSAEEDDLDQRIFVLGYDPYKRVSLYDVSCSQCIPKLKSDNVIPNLR